MAERFSLKDHLFNKAKVSNLAAELKAVHPSFKDQAFTKDVVAKFPRLELLERVDWMQQMLKKYLPDDYKQALKIIIKALPSELDPSKTDDDFGDFIYAPYGYYVSSNGCNSKYLGISLDAIEQITRRFSMEGPIREFLNSFPHDTALQMTEWSHSDNYHVRRLSSEGLRPKLPWAPKISIDYHKAVPILNTLHSDETRYVTRSVANHLNDIAKFDPELVVSLLKNWHKQAEQDPKELEWMTKHALRTLLKQGNPAALQLLGFSDNPAITVKKFQIVTPKLQLGEALEFEFEVVSSADQKLLIDYVLHFKTKNGQHSDKVFKLKQLEATKGETVVVRKEHPFKSMTTRSLYTGVQKLELQINGQRQKLASFELTV